MDFGMLTNLVKEALAPTWHRARIECFLEMLRGLFLTQSVNTYRLAQRMDGDVQFESHAQRIRRLLAEQVFDWSVIGRLLLRLAGIHAKSRVVVAVDRTNWNFGTTAINFLVISVVVSGIGVPVVWTQLGKKGNSKTSERLDLLERFPDWFRRIRSRCCWRTGSSSARVGSPRCRSRGFRTPFAFGTTSSSRQRMAPASRHRRWPSGSRGGKRSCGPGSNWMGCGVHCP